MSNNPSSRFYLRPDLRQTRPTCRNPTPSIWPSWFLQHVPSLISRVFGNVFHNKQTKQNGEHVTHPFITSLNPLRNFYLVSLSRRRFFVTSFFFVHKIQAQVIMIACTLKYIWICICKAKELFPKALVMPCLDSNQKIQSKCLYKIPKIQIGSPLLLEHLPLCDVEWDFGESLQKILRIAERRRYASLWRVLPRGKDKGNRWGSNVNIYQPLLGILMFSFQSSVQLTKATVFGLWKKLANTNFAESGWDILISWPECHMYGTQKDLSDAWTVSMWHWDTVPRTVGMRSSNDWRRGWNQSWTHARRNMFGAVLERV